MTNKDQYNQPSSKTSSRTGSAGAAPATGTPANDGPGKFWVGWFDPRALAVLGLAVVALACIAAIIALWANNNPPPVAITRPASGASLNAASLGNVEGTAAPGALVKVYDGATLLGEARADNSGRWVLAMPAGLAAGAHTLKVDATDSANRVTSATLPWTIAAPAAPAAAALPALTKPVVNLPAAGGAFVVGQAISFAGNATPGSTVRLIGPDGRVLGTTVAGADGKWTLGIPAALGLGPIFARVTGPDGVNFDSAPVNFTINPAATAVPPPPAPIAPVFGVLPGIFAPGNALKDAPAGVKGPAYESVAEISGSAAPNAKMRIYDGDKLVGETSADAKGNWTFKFTSPLAAGAHTFTAAGIDGANEGPRSVAQAFTIVPAQVAAAAATKAPEAAPVKPAILGPVAGASFIAGQPIDFSGTAAPDATVQIFGADGKVIGTAIAGPDGKWSFKLASVSAGMGPFIVRVTGADGKAIDSAPLALNIAAAPAATVAPTAIAAPTATPSVLLGVTGGQPDNAPTVPLLIGVAAILALLAASMTRRRTR